MMISQVNSLKLFNLGEKEAVTFPIWGLTMLWLVPGGELQVSVARSSSPHVGWLCQQCPWPCCRHRSH